MAAADAAGAAAAVADPLLAAVHEGGDNWSVGQKQLLCLARAILKPNCKVVVLDEATANIDAKTDGVVQRTMRQAFATCTTITVAHRVGTVLDSDAILVLEDGRVAEFGAPELLLRRNGGQGPFARMVAKQQESEAAPGAAETQS